MDMEEQMKKEFSWKWYLILVIIAEIITIFFTSKIWLNAEGIEGLGIIPILVFNSLIIFISSTMEFIKYKKYKAKGHNIVANIIVAVFSSIMITIGCYLLNMLLIFFLEGLFSIEGILIVFTYLIIGFILIFPVFKHNN